MVRKYIFGEPIETDAVVKEIASSAWCDGVFQKKEGLALHQQLQ